MDFFKKVIVSEAAYIELITMVDSHSVSYAADVTTLMGSLTPRANLKIN